MLDELTEKKIRRHYKDPFHPEFMKAWNSALNDADVQSALRRLLFVPCEDPDIDQSAILVDLFKALNGAPHRLLFHMELVTTTAQILHVDQDWDQEGPDFHVTYVYRVGETGDVIEGYHCFAYNGVHAAKAGWSPDRLERHWREGRILECRYQKKSPLEHAIQSPFGWRPSAQSAYFRPLSAS